MSKIVFSVSELNQASQQILEDHFPAIWVEGEISNLVKPTSGHFYFSLKDPKAQVRCAFFRFQSRSLSFELKNGLLVQVLAKVSLYPDRGDYQLIVQQVEMAGDGLLKKAYEALIAKLTQEGLFELTPTGQYEKKIKKPLPTFPKQIGVITSSTGAAIHDILNVLKRRFPYTPILLYPTKVQGLEAAKEIVNAINLANKHQASDVLILARGGGSLEDLWPFNEEIVARAVFNSTIPIVTGIGHEIDFTIADFVADKRAPTPSAAAELVVPNQQTLLQQFALFESRLVNDMLKYLQRLAQQVDRLFRHIRHPGLELKNQLVQIKSLENRLINAMQQLLKQKGLAIQNVMRALNTVSPLATLERGYAVVSIEEKDGKEKIVRSITETTIGDILKIKLADGSIWAKQSPLPVSGEGGT